MSTDIEAWHLLRFFVITIFSFVVTKSFTVCLEQNTYGRMGNRNNQYLTFNSLHFAVAHKV